MTRLRRSVHFVPGNSERKLRAALNLSADSLVLDLEDSVTGDGKDQARERVATWLANEDFGSKERVVRLNSLDTPWIELDLRETLPHRPDAYMVPKARSPDDIHWYDRKLTELEHEFGQPSRGVKLIIIGTETPEGLLNTRELASSPRVDALAWGAEDLSAALGATRSRDDTGGFLDVFRYARAMTLLSAAAADVQPIDGVYVDLDDPAGLRAECRESAQMGYQGKMTIHPSQVEIVNDAFTPSIEDIEKAKNLLEAFEEHAAAGTMTFLFQGQMVDRPHLVRARAILERAQLAGVVE